MNLRHATNLLTTVLLTLTIGAIAGVNIPSGSITGNLKSVPSTWGDANRAGVERGGDSDTTHGWTSDAQLKEELQNALNKDWDLHRARIVVESVDHGVVTLSGSAEALSYHIRAVELVSNFPGVQGVKSRFKTLESLSGIDIWKAPRESEDGGDAWQAWMIVPIGDDNREDDE